MYGCLRYIVFFFVWHICTFCVGVHPLGIEPKPTEPESVILSFKLRVHILLYCVLPFIKQDANVIILVYFMPIRNRKIHSFS